MDNLRIIESANGTVVRLLKIKSIRFRGILKKIGLDEVVPATQTIFALEFVRSLESSASVGNRFHVSPIFKIKTWYSHAYRCQGCHTLFVVTRLDDLDHECTGAAS